MRTEVHYGPATTYTWPDGQQTTLYRCEFMDAIPAQFVADILCGEVYSLTSSRQLAAELRKCLDTQYNPRHLPSLIASVEVTPVYIDILGPYQYDNGRDRLPIHHGYTNWAIANGDVYQPIAATYMRMGVS